MATQNKKYDLSKYISAALSTNRQGQTLSNEHDTDTDNYLLAQRVLDLQIANDDEVVMQYVDHAQAIASDVIRIVSANEDSDTTALTVLSGPDSDIEDGKISLGQSLYLLGLMYGLQPFTVLDMLQLSHICPAIWAKSKNKLYDQYLDLIKTMQAEQLEAIVMDQAMQDKNTLERMFALKARKPEYRDNAPPPASASVTIKVTVDGDYLDSSLGRREAIELDDIPE